MNFLWTSNISFDLILIYKITKKLKIRKLFNHLWKGVRSGRGKNYTAKTMVLHCESHTSMPCEGNRICVIARTYHAMITLVYLS